MYLRGCTNLEEDYGNRDMEMTCETETSILKSILKKPSLHTICFCNSDLCNASSKIQISLLVTIFVTLQAILI